MPYTKDKPPARIKKLPAHARAIWISAYNSAIKQYKGDEKKANATAWAAVSRDYKKVGDKWVKKMDEMKYFSMAFSKISKRQGIMHFELTSSDTDWDTEEERLTLEIFDDFRRQEEEKKAKLEEEYIPPYLSMSHYRMPIGDVNEIWTQGERFKNRGIFYDDKFGRALFKAILEERTSGEEVEKPIKVSIGFWPREAREENGRIAYTKGEFDHVAATRVPINVRATFDEVIEKSMLTKKDDATSIIGEELAIELDDDERSRMEKGDLKDGMVIKAEDEDILKSLLEDEDSKVDCDRLWAAIQAIGKGEAGKPVNVPSDVLSKAKRLYAKRCKGKGKGLVSIGESPVVVDRPYGGATSIADAVAYMESREVVWDIRDDLHIFSEVAENILKSPEVEDKKSAMAKAIKELEGKLEEDLMSKDKEKASVLDLLEEGIKDPDATEEKGDQVVEPAPEKESSLDALFGVLKTVVRNEDLDRAGKVAGAFQCLKAISAACDRIIEESTPRTPADVIAEISEAASKAAFDKMIEAIKPLAEKITILEATMRAPSGDPQRKGLTVIEKAQVQGREPVKKGTIAYYAALASGLDPETGEAIF